MWKQPIPTTCLGWDLVTRIVFVEIMLRARNEDMLAPEEFYHGNHRFLIMLKKGQCIFSIDRFRKELKLPRSRIFKSFSLLISGELGVKLQSITRSYGMEITILNYDELTEMQSKQKAKEKQTESKKTTSNKSVKIVKSVKSEKRERGNSLADFIENKDQILSRTKELYPDKEVDRAAEDFIGYCEKKSPGYSNFEKAFKDWVRKDRFNEYQKKLTNLDGLKRIQIK